jgi:hypothetical protein
MTQAEIVSRLFRLIDDPAADALYSITMLHILKQIALRMGEDALSLSEADLQILRGEVEAAIQEMIDYRDAIDEGIETFRITRNL